MLTDRLIWRGAIDLPQSWIVERSLFENFELKEAMVMTELSHVWVVRTAMRDLHGWYYVGVETESEAHGLVAKKR
jgi:hypothetical protein